MSCVPAVFAAVDRVDVHAVADVSTNSHIAYERLHGTIYFAFDPELPVNQAIVDIENAPRDPTGRVRASADFVVLRPKDSSLSAQVALLEVSNRGGQASLRYFNRGSRYSGLPVSESHFGDGLLMRHGLTLIWVGWQFDVPCEPWRLRATVPIAISGDQPVTGLPRADWVVEQTRRTLAIGHRNHWAYPVLFANDSENVLTWRASRRASREIVPQSEWRFSKISADGQERRSYTHISSPAGFEPGIYELVYRAAHPRVVGLGLAIVRDTMAYAKNDPESLFPVKQGLAFGVSQTGRFLRHFLYQGFNVDETGRRVFDGMLIHSAGAGRGSFNHRFAQPSRDAHQNSAFFYPTDLFPFSGRTQRDAISGVTDGLLSVYEDESLLPNIMYTNTGYEYWGRAASLIHTSPDAKADVLPLPNERIYHIASAQHYQEHGQPRDSDKLVVDKIWRGNPSPFLVNLRALIIGLKDWVSGDALPPVSRYPRYADDTLTDIEELRLPDVGIRKPQVVHVAYRADYGERFKKGIIDTQPPHLGEAFPSRVPQNDELGNELGGIRNVWIAVPIATFLPWNRHGDFALTDFRGTFIPLSTAITDRDPRPSVSELYQDQAKFLDLSRRAAHDLVAAGYLLAEDADWVVDYNRSLWEWLHTD